MVPEIPWAKNANHTKLNQKTKQKTQNKAIKQIELINKDSNICDCKVNSIRFIHLFLNANIKNYNIKYDTGTIQELQESQRFVKIECIIVIASTR